MHVTKGAKPPLESGYVQTGRHPNMNNYIPTVYALDCEMVCVCATFSDYFCCTGSTSMLFSNAVTDYILVTALLESITHQQFW